MSESALNQAEVCHTLVVMKYVLVWLYAVRIALHGRRLRLHPSSTTYLSAPLQPQNHTRRDLLLQIQHDAQVGHDHAVCTLSVHRRH